jgi:hypothetical protein
MGNNNYKYIIKDIKSGKGSQSVFLYASVEKIGEGLVCKATLDFILKEYYNRMELVQNYKDALFVFLERDKIEITFHTLIEIKRAFRVLLEDKNSYIHKAFSDDNVYNAIDEINNICKNKIT